MPLKKDYEHREQVKVVAGTYAGKEGIFLRAIGAKKVMCDVEIQGATKSIYYSSIRPAATHAEKRRQEEEIRRQKQEIDRQQQEIDELVETMRSMNITMGRLQEKVDELEHLKRKKL
ncbi:unknown protein [Seminavis robusta]|uniref:KOW domain-containing protein n=1 Tax=Seminavis robusta TaxID=568900 RepID=A0A9N8EX94_9STRA|nr:unknown protein [Seminavis robusta]|eukprot:Sro1965_g308240.1 n/a (117) ;mRNA; f:1684-2034